ncbi:relaxase/mobilization nuclease domain-containing protein [Vibrio parahaemolyticus]|nr:relaxase/mobilization nuclease domain-containing protein [Vibrio parahaemolyticus]MCZ6382192.1 relaxase/mobilization nuclease domain-containing protein [Vibrio parahaemolyticus]MCZ6404715.1 relaxase/mobilization nuclease domain-containing protein [Vibrio parahaemolyticus]
MIVKFHARGVGKGSGPVDYLLGKQRDREGATLDRGSPSEVQELIDSSPYAKKYTSGVLSFEESDLPRETKDHIMSSFEKALLPGLEVDQYSCLWVEHRDKGRLELNFVVPNVELQTGKRLQPYFDRADKPRINAWKTGMNATLKLHDPDDPLHKRELVTPRNLPVQKQEAARAITDGLLSLAQNGDIQDRTQVVEVLERSGFQVVRQTSKSLSIADPEGGRNIRLKGMMYEQDFRFGAGLREEIEAASARYRAASQERIREAREVYRTGVEIKRAENQRRYKRPESTHERVSPEKLGVDRVEYLSRDSGVLRRDLVARERDSSEPIRDQSAECHDKTARIEGRKDSVEPMRREDLYSRRQGWEGVDEKKRRPTDVYTRGILEHDGIRETAFERLRAITTAARDATQSLCERLQGFREDVQHYFERERHVAPASEQIKRASERLERSAPAVGKALQHEKELGFERKEREFTMSFWR